jgi:hypothetical protein
VPGFVPQVENRAEKLARVILADGIASERNPTVFNRRVLLNVGACARLKPDGLEIPVFRAVLFEKAVDLSSIAWLVFVDRQTTPFAHLIQS